MQNRGFNMSEIEGSRVKENLMHGIDEGTFIYSLSSTLCIYLEPIGFKTKSSRIFLRV